MSAIRPACVRVADNVSVSGCVSASVCGKSAGSVENKKTTRVCFHIYICLNTLWGEKGRRGSCRTHLLYTYTYHHI